MCHGNRVGHDLAVPVRLREFGHPLARRMDRVRTAYDPRPETLRLAGRCTTAGSTAIPTSSWPGARTAASSRRLFGRRVPHARRHRGHVRRPVLPRRRPRRDFRRGARRPRGPRRSSISRGVTGSVPIDLFEQRGHTGTRALLRAADRSRVRVDRRTRRPARRGPLQLDRQDGRGDAAPLGPAHHSVVTERPAPVPREPVPYAARVSLLRRLELLRDRDLTLATFAERLARVHGTAPLVEEHGEGGWRLEYEDAAAIVARWADTLRRRVAPGDRVVVALPNGYAVFLLTQAVTAPVVSPCPSTRRCDKTRWTTSCVTRPPHSSWTTRASSRAASRRGRYRWIRRRRGALLHVGHDGPPQGRRAHTPCPPRTAPTERGAVPVGLAPRRGRLGHAGRAHPGLHCSCSWPRSASPSTCCGSSGPTSPSTPSSSGEPRSSSACRRCTG